MPSPRRAASSTGTSAYGELRTPILKVYRRICCRRARRHARPTIRCSGPDTTTKFGLNWRPMSGSAPARHVGGRRARTGHRRAVRNLRAIRHDDSGSVLAVPDEVGRDRRRICWTLGVPDDGTRSRTRRSPSSPAAIRRSCRKSPRATPRASCPARTGRRACRGPSR